MNRRLIPILVVTLVVAVTPAAWAPTAAAVTYGLPDGGGHPNVGALVAEVPAGPGPGGVIFDGGQVAISSGTLIAPRVFLTAGHSLAMLQAMGITQVWVTFDPVFARGTSTLVPGTMHANPDFRWVASDPNDLAVVTFDHDVASSEDCAQLPSAGLLDQLGAKNGLKSETFMVVGYGLQEASFGGGPPAFGSGGERRVVTSAFNALTPAMLHLCANPALGYGGSNYYDSGGPNFLGDTNVIAAITVSGDAMARALHVGCRLDTPAAQSYLAPFMP